MIFCYSVSHHASILLDADRDSVNEDGAKNLSKVQMRKMKSEELLSSDSYGYGAYCIRAEFSMRHTAECKKNVETN